MGQVSHNVRSLDCTYSISHNICPQHFCTLFVVVVFRILSKLLYASTFRNRRHYVFGLSVRPSVRSPKYPLLTCTWVRWSTRPTVTILRHVRPSVCPSVRLERFPGICRRMHGGISLKFYMLMYLDYLQSWLVYGHGLLIFQFWHYFDLVKRVKFGVSGHIQENAWREWPEICTLMYLDHFQDWLVYGDSLLIVLILALFWLSETGQIWGFRSFPGERMEEMTWILHPDVSWPPSDLISLWSCSVDFFFNFCAILT